MTMTRPYFDYRTCTADLRNELYKIGRKKGSYTRLKRILAVLYKQNYFDQNLSDYNCNTRIGKAQIITLANEILDPQFVTESTIKKRGWTDTLIIKYLSIDIYARNPYYKSSGDMRLYCLSKVEILEKKEKYIQEYTKKILARRERKKQKEKSRIIDAAIKFIAAIGDPDVAMAILTTTVLKNSGKTGNYEFFKKLIDNNIYKLKDKGYLAASYKLSNGVSCFVQTYIHFFNINGYKTSFEIDHSLNANNILDFHKLYVDYYYGSDSCYKDVFFKITGLKNCKELGNCYKLISEYDFLGRFQINKIVEEFKPVKYIEPPPKELVDFIKSLKETKEEFRRIKQPILLLRKYKKDGCPNGYNCWNMIGKFDINGVCLNYQNCKDLANG